MCDQIPDSSMGYLLVMAFRDVLSKGHLGSASWVQVAGAEFYNNLLISIILKF
jgi:hypothetical protein